MDDKRLINMKAVEEIWLKKEVYGGYSIVIHMMSGGVISIPGSETETIQIVYDRLKENFGLGNIVELVGYA